MLGAFGTVVFEDAVEPFVFGPLTLRQIVTAKSKKSNHCAAQQCLKDNEFVEAALVFEYVTYIKFRSHDIVVRYMNSDTMRENIIRPNDEDDYDEIDTECEHVLEVPKGARTLAYNKDRRDKIKRGLITVKKRGPLKEPRKVVIHHRSF
jgi:hypothetical protein